MTVYSSTALIPFLCTAFVPEKLSQLSGGNGRLCTPYLPRLRSHAVSSTTGLTRSGRGGGIETHQRVGCTSHDESSGREAHPLYTKNESPPRNISYVPRRAYSSSSPVHKARITYHVGRDMPRRGLTDFCLVLLPFAWSGHGAQQLFLTPKLPFAGTQFIILYTRVQTP